MAARSQDGIDTGDAFDNVLSANNDNFEDESWPGGSVAERAERLQSNAALRAMDKRQRRNNTLFFGEFTHLLPTQGKKAGFRTHLAEFTFDITGENFLQRLNLIVRKEL